MRAVYKRKLSVALTMVAVAVVTGPFGTFEEMPPWIRLPYWGLAIGGIFLIMLAAVEYARMRLFPRWHPVWRIVFGSVVGAPLAALYLMSIDTVLRQDVFTPFNFTRRAILIALISFGVGVAEGYLRPQERARREAEPDTPPAPAPVVEVPLFLRNLDPALGTELISVSTQDHYLDVVTAAGETRILKRMSDALAELDGFPGMQIHRSHWVALDAIERVEREGRKCQVVLKNGRTLPVSRPNIPILAERLENR